MVVACQILTCITNCASTLQCLACVNYPMLCTIYHRGTRHPARLTVLNMLIVHILPWKLLVTASAMKTLSKMNSDDVAGNRVFEHCFGAPIPQTLGRVLRMFLSGVPFADVSADSGSGGDNPHSA